MRESCLTLLASFGCSTLAGCVLPDDDPTGIELSWHFVETNVADGEASQRTRTCAGAGVSSIKVEVVDVDEPTRRGSFRFECAAGFQTRDEFQREASDIFIPLNPGEYTMRAYADEHEGIGENLVDVSGRGLSFANFALQRAPLEWDLVLTQLDACETFSLRLQYADPDHVVLEDVTGDDDDDDDDDEPAGEMPPLVYRQALQSNRALSLVGEDLACGEAFAGTHRFSGVDPGIYDLVVTVDGETCVRTLELPRDNPLTLDLETRPCSG